MEKVDIDFLRKQWKEELKYYWEPLQKEINDYFEMIKVTNRWEAQRKLTKSKQEILEDFYLTEEKIKDPLFIPKMIPLLEEIKENNFNLFTRDWVSDHYNHYKRAFNIKNTLIPALIPVADKIIKFKVSQYNSLYDKPKLPLPEKEFIIKNFEKFELKHYESYLKLINRIAYHDEFYVILPNLLRMLFENILHDLFAMSLDNEHKELFYNKDKNRIADFSTLIKLLNFLSQNEFKAYIGDKIHLRVIQFLNKIKDDGNLTVHGIIRKIPRNYSNDIQDKLDLVLDSLLVSFNLLKDKKIIISKERLEFIKKKLGLKSKIIKKKSILGNDIEIQATKDLKNHFKSEIIEENQEVQIKCVNSLHTLCSYLYGIEVGHYDKDSQKVISSLNLLKTYKDLILPLGITYLDEPTKITTGMFAFVEGVKIFVNANCERSIEIILDLFQFKIVTIHKFHIDGREFQDFEDISQILECLRKKIC